uniref:ERO1-like protein alpha-like n=1 Tax=Saccoglossus kowalevskii TaxID=10224 RepID=A0ABM0MSA7_SACKO|nr:PREDICTED: ERO1-like protein alpha-like [Saccoglossus kowalevskii]
MELYGEVDDCSCKVDTVDYFNNYKIHPRLVELLEKNFFRFYKVNLHRECPFWPDDGQCAFKDCSVHSCTPDELPKGFKPENKYSEEAQQSDSGACESKTNEEIQLGALDTSLSEESKEAFKSWKRHDDDQFSFCEMDDEFSTQMEYVDLLINPERYTGYKGASPRRVWNSIYNENCFKPDPDTREYEALLTTSNVKGMCLEKRVFYRMISGLHASINIHLAAKYLIPDAWGGTKWGININEFQSRFDPKSTNGEGPQWLRNLYFTYLVELRAITKIAPLLEKENFYTGDKGADFEVKVMISELLSTMKEFPTPFNESKMFQGDKNQALQLKEEFRSHFRNISRIMDCVGCDKCKLWGKLQTQGMGTALKILFSGNIYDTVTGEPAFSLRRTEIVSLFNAFGRLSNSIKLLEEIRNMTKR